MKGITVNATQLAAVECASQDESRLALTGIAVWPDRVEATDGSIAVTVYGDGLEADQMPAGKLGMEDVTLPDGKPVMLSADAARKLAKGIKALGRNAPIPALAHAVVGIDSEGRTRAAQTDLASTIQVNETPSSLEFPDLAKVTPKGKPVLSVGLDLDYLSKLAKIIKASGARSAMVRFDFYGEADRRAMRIHYNGGEARIEAVLMPCRVAEWKDDSKEESAA